MGQTQEMVGTLNIEKADREDTTTVPSLLSSGVSTTESILHARDDILCKAGDGMSTNNKQDPISTVEIAGINEYEDDWKNDPDNARNWSKPRKWTAVAIVALYCFITPLSSSMMAPGLPQVAEKYQITNSTLLGLTLSIFLISFALGPLIMSPLSEIYGRTWILHISNLFTLGFNLGCAFAPDTTSLLILRFMAGFWASAPVAIGGGTIGDLFEESDRASAMALFSMGPLFGPAIGPVAAGFVVQEIGIRWVFILIAIMSGVAAVFGIPFLRETYAPIIRLRKAKQSPNPEVAKAKVVESLGAPVGSKVHVISVNISRPIALLFGNFVCFILSLYMAFVYGVYYLMFSTFARLFRDVYGFKPGVGGLTYLGLGLGFFAATFVGAKFSDRMYCSLAKKSGGKGTPEMRMPALVAAGFIVPIGLLWYGWSAHARVHWIMPIAGTFIYGFGLMTAYLPIQLYLVDAFTYAASATGAASVFRSILGFAFPLFGQQMSDKLGLGPANTLLAGIAILIGIPFPIWIYYKGAAIRERSNVTR